MPEGNDYTKLYVKQINAKILPAVYAEDFARKWRQSGGDASFLGAPTTQVQLCPDKAGLYQHFQGGSLYWHEGKLHEVLGAIREKWAEMGWERGWLGYPTSDEYLTRANARRSDFQHGSIEWRPESGAVAFGDCVLWFTGLICFGEQSPLNEHGDSDEPYLIVSTYDGNLKVATQKFPPDQPAYDEVNSGTVIKFRGACYQGRPSHLNIHCILMEHDQGDPDAYRERIDDYVRTAITSGEVASAALGTPLSIPSEAGDLLTEIINALAMTGDDRIAEGHEAFGWQQISRLIATPAQEERGILYHFFTYLTDGDATYKAYFLFDR